MILKRKTGAVDLFIDLVEKFLPSYLDASSFELEYPLETEEDLRRRLDSVAKRARDLAAAVDKLNPYFSGSRLEQLNWKMGPYAIDLDQLRETLDVLQAIATAVAQQQHQRTAGRPPARVHYAFIRHCYDAYREAFGHVPALSHRSQFQNFIVGVSSAILPAGQGLQGNITKLVKAALAATEKHS